ncbi:nucleotidyltransferase domain-containing protein [Streptacidiphilus sp. P02-A3a]|uniref:nucleotidyltransferase domain-containing protein n=1 Tax=Streptacidiphilus sp. P02-A3a TaxID=2704468 RepID=UPI0015F793E2|nr:nucleotidyltransferase domain-containing protein [Streptacidiphilus sp. P02-A3a]QMU69775.1 nucleotidyltransferase domain-containing protein [Streptacidiphilus sp. P02-A3a]
MSRPQTLHDGPPAATGTAALCADARQQVAHSFREHLGRRLRTLALFGSVAADGPLWAGSDLDVVLVVHPSAAGTAEVCAQVALAAHEIEQRVGLPVSAAFGTLDEVTLLWSATVRRALRDNATTLAGEPLADLLTPPGDAWDWTEVHRGAVRLLCFTRRHIIDRYTALIGQGLRGDAAADGAQAVLKSTVNAARFALWSLTPEHGRLLSRPDTVLTAFEAALPGVVGDIPRQALGRLEHGGVPEPELVRACVDLADRLLHTSRHRHPDLFRRGDVFIDPL